MSKVLELFTHSTIRRDVDWKSIVKNQVCTFTGKKCFKVRKSDAETSIGTCTVAYPEGSPVIICPTRLIERRQIFLDCMHLLTTHEPGNQLHIVPEVSIPGGTVDYFLVSVGKDGKVKDFVGIELQTLDTTGTVWPERQRLLKELGLPRSDKAEESTKPYGMNWKMTAKTILVQMHHKAQTFEHVNKKLTLVVQDRLLEYMKGEFNFGHLRNPASIGDAVHFHAYSLGLAGSDYQISLDSRLSTDVDGIAQCLGLQAESRVELEQIVASLQAKISASTLFKPF